MNRIIMTMSSRWNVATAKAELSLVLERARRTPQVIEKRGEPIAVVVGVQDYERMAERGRRASRWKAFLALSEAVRADAGTDLELPKRTTRRSPFDRKRR